jgi:hypothetical protein
LASRLAKGLHEAVEERSAFLGAGYAWAADDAGPAMEVVFYRSKRNY